MIERYKFTVSYDGTLYLGFQAQKNSKTVQRELESALRKLGWKEDSIIGAGRTDSGVHAEGQVFSAGLAWKHGETALIRAMNASLPNDISIKKVEKAGSEFHARFDALSRCYHYHVYQTSVRDPLRDRFAWQIWPELDLKALNKAAEWFIGRFDFRAFGSPPRRDRGTVREIYESNWVQKTADEKIYIIRANAFLYHMVRHIVSVQVQYAQGWIGEDEIISAIHSAQPMSLGLAPANGLRLFEVDYR